MATYSTRICADESTKPQVTELVALCQVCHVQWAIRSGQSADAEGCTFCGAPADAVTIVSEAPDYSGQVVY